jgi:hypothetical protein
VQRFGVLRVADDGILAVEVSEPCNIVGVDGGDLILENLHAGDCRRSSGQIAPWSHGWLHFRKGTDGDDRPLDTHVRQTEVLKENRRPDSTQSLEPVDFEPLPKCAPYTLANRRLRFGARTLEAMRPELRPYDCMDRRCNVTA